MSGEVVELRKSFAPELAAAVKHVTDHLEEKGRVTGFALIVFAENAKRQPITEQVFSVPNLTEAVGAVSLLHADLIEEFRDNEGQCPRDAILDKAEARRRRKNCATRGRHEQGAPRMSAEAAIAPPAGRARWLALIGALATQAISLGATFSAFGFVLVPIAKEFGAEVSTVNLGLVAFLPAQAAFGLALGPLVDRFGPRIAMLVGALISTLGCLMIWQAQSLGVAGVGFVLAVAPASGALGALPASKLVADWFPDMRGTALGICGIGPSIGALTAPFLIATAVAAWGWRGAVLACAIAFAALIPLVGLIVREAPSSRTAPATGAHAPAAGAFLGDSNFWAITVCFGICFSVMLSLGNAYPAYGAETRGITGQHVSLLLGASAIVGVAANLGFGWLADRFARIPLIWAAQLPLALSAGVLALTPDVRWLLPIAIAAGIAQGLTALWTATIGDRFEPRVFGSVMGAMGFCMLPLTMSNIQLPMVVFARTGRFEFAFAAFAGLLVLAAVTIGFLGPRRSTA